MSNSGSELEFLTSAPDIETMMERGQNLGAKVERAPNPNNGSFGLGAAECSPATASASRLLIGGPSRLTPEEGVKHKTG